MSPQKSFGERPRIAHITNHGYAGVDVPYGGAPDTGGQNMYVNALVKAMVELGYHVTVFARGGFTFFESDHLREGIEEFGEHARYVYVPGGGGEFLRKEDIAIALDEEVDWLEEFNDAEARQLGCEPWEVYEFVNTHYWDAGVMGMLLVERWQARRAAEIISDLLSDVVPGGLEELTTLGYRTGVGHEPAHLLGRWLAEAVDPMLPPTDRARAAVELWGHHWAPDRAAAAANDAAGRVAADVASGISPAVTPLVVADVVGHAVLKLWDPDSRKLKAALVEANTHVFTPHSLGDLKDENYRDRSLKVRRDLKFCERRNHERTLCRATRVFAATSTEIAERLHTHLDVGLDQMFFFPPGVDREQFREYSAEELEPVYAYLAEKSGLDVDTLKQATIAFETSRMDRTKRKDLLLSAFARAAPEVDNTYLFIGGGPEKELFQTLQTQRDADPVLRERAFLLGFVPDELLYPMFAMADLFVTASEMEGFGMSAAQAAAVGTPLITSHLVPFSVQYVPEAAMICRAGDAEAFAAAMVKLLSEREEREERGGKLKEKTASLDWVALSAAFIDHIRREGIPVRKPGRD